MPEFREDQDIWPYMIGLRDCLCKEIEKSGLPIPCQCEVMLGSQPIYDYPDPGQAWVRLVTAYPSVSFPNQDQSSRNCASPLVAQLEIGIIRCAPTLSVDGKAPPAEEVFDATRLQLADMRAMQRAVRCCLGKSPHVLGRYTPIGPLGDAYGGTWEVYI